MLIKTPKNRRSRSFFFYLLIVMVLLAVIVVGLLTMNVFLTTRNLIDENSVQIQSQTEQNIIATIRLADASFTIFDNSLNKEMNLGLDHVMQEYHRAGNDPAKMDLDAVRQGLGDQFDIYIINESGVIEYTTFQPELGVDFKKVPYFYEYLTGIRNSEGFFPDRIVKENGGNGPLRKYAYMPTPDHRYIFELGLKGNTFSKDRAALNYQNIINTLAANNPSIEHIRIFDITGHLVDTPTYVPDDVTKATLIGVISNRSGTIIKQPTPGKSVTYLFIDLKNKEYGSDLSRIVEITYNTTLMETVLSSQFAQIALIVLLGLVVGCGSAFILSRYLSQPIEEIVSDMDRIAKGDLNCRIASMDVAEFQVLEHGINQMVRSLCEALDKIHESETALMASELKYRDLYISAPIALFEINLTNNSLVVGNQHLCNLFGIASLEYIIGASSFSDSVSPSDLEKARTILYRDGFFNGREMQFRSPTTGRVFWGEVSARLKNNGYVAEGSIVDITTRKEVEEELRKLYNELEARVADRTSELKSSQESFRQANSKLNLLNSVTRHDILNQLTALMGYLSLLKDGGETLNPQSHDFITRAQQVARNIEGQIQFTKTYQDIGVHAPKWQNVEGLIKKAKTGLLPESISLTMNLIDLRIYADPLLENIFYTLLDNALRHGIQVTEIRFSYHVTDDETLNLIYVDNGVGISFDDKEKIFKRGYGKNTGLGLFLTKEILSITGLAITETGEPGKGARFEISVPKGQYRFVP